jgi:RNA polymerase sigma-70 factor (ECF subfamily)
MVLMQQVLNATGRNSQRNVAVSVTQSDDEWLRLCQQHTRPLLTFTLRLTGGDQERADAIVQQTLLLAWRNADRLGSMSALRPWLRTTARRVAAGQEAAVQQTLFAMEDAGRPDNRGRVAAALERLAPEQRAALAEACLARKTVGAVARSAGVSTRVIKVQVFQALEAIRRSVPQGQPVH